MSLDQESAAGPVSASKGRWREYTQLSRQVKQAGLLDRRRGWYGARIGANLALLAAGWLAFVVLGASWWQLVTAAYLAVVFTQLAFLGHDAGHRQISRSRRTNDRVGLVHANLLVGVSFDWWVDKHNRHHTNPNHEDLDPDISITALAFHRRPGQIQARAGPDAGPLPGLAVLPPAAAGGGPPPSGQRQGRPPRLGPGQRGRGAAVAGPCRRLPGGRAVGAVAAAGGGVHRGPAGAVRPVPGLCVRPQPQGHAHPHRSRRARLHAPPGPDLPQRDRQPLCRLPPRRPQLPDRAPPVPHHARPNLRLAQPLVRAFCAQHGLPYTEASLFGSYAEAVRHLHTVGAPLRPAVAE